MYEDDNLLIDSVDECVYIYFKCHELEESNVKKMIKLRNELYDFPAYYIFDARNIKWASIGALREMSSDDAYKNITSSATIVTSKVGIMLGNMYYKMISPGYPTRLFYNYDDAIKWLEKLHKKELPRFNAHFDEKDELDYNQN